MLSAHTPDAGGSVVFTLDTVVTAALDGNNPFTVIETANPGVFDTFLGSTVTYDYGGEGTAGNHWELSPMGEPYDITFAGGIHLAPGQTGVIT